MCLNLLKKFKLKAWRVYFHFKEAILSFKRSRFLMESYSGADSCSCYLKRQCASIFSVFSFSLVNMPFRPPKIIGVKSLLEMSPLTVRLLLCGGLYYWSAVLRIKVLFSFWKRGEMPQLWCNSILATVISVLHHPAPESSSLTGNESQL